MAAMTAGKTENRRAKESVVEKVEKMAASSELQLASTSADQMAGKMAATTDALKVVAMVAPWGN